MSGHGFCVLGNRKNIVRCFLDHGAKELRFGAVRAGSMVYKPMTGIVSSGGLGNLNVRLNIAHLYVHRISVKPPSVYIDTNNVYNDIQYLDW